MERSEPSVRCSRCLLPSSLPGSNFNCAGECAWCQCDFPAYAPQGEDRLVDVIEQTRDPKAAADCLVGISGGKDSSYAVLQLKHRFGLRVEAFTYVHDAMTEFAQETARAVCRKLGVKQHVLSLPGRTHVDLFTAFFEAWIESGDPFVAATTCAACKHMHLLGTRLAKERGIPLVVWANCPLENPPVSGVKEGDSAGTVYPGARSLLPHLGRRLRADRKFRRAFGRHASTCLLGWLAVRPESPYLHWRYPQVRHLRYYDYCRWQRDEIVSALRAQADWDTPTQEPNDWHSDCLLHVLKEYMSQFTLGAGSDDAHLSNQIRHGLLTREQASRELIRIKAHQAAAVPEVLSFLGLQHLESRLDLSCFDIAEEVACPPP